MRRVFDPVFVKIYALAGGGGVAFTMLFCTSEDIADAAWRICFLLHIAWWCFGPIYLGVFLLFLSPSTAHKSAIKIKHAMPYLFPLPEQEEAPALAAGIGIGEDILIRFESATESGSEYAKRGKSALQMKDRNGWILFAVRFERKWMYVRKDGTEGELDRDKLPWQPVVDTFQTIGNRYDKEGWEDYVTDLTQICAGWRAWALSEKTGLAPEKQKALVYLDTLIARSIGAFILCLFSLSLFAQPKTEQVATFLGPSRANLKPVGPVVFRFGTSLEIYREGDGTKTITQLLPMGRSFNDKDVDGPLMSVSVTLKNKLVSIAPMVHIPVLKKKDIGTDIPQGTSPEEMRRYMRPNRDTTARASVPTSSGSMEWAMDSAAMTTKINEAKEKLSGLVIPLWSGVMIGCNVFFYAILYLLGISRFASIICNNETRINSWGGRVYGSWMADIGSAATALTFSIAFIVALIVLTNVYLNLLIGSFSGLFAALFSQKALFAYGWVVILWLAARAFDKWVPNPKIINRGNFPARQ